MRTSNPSSRVRRGIGVLGLVELARHLDLKPKPDIRLTIQVYQRVTRPTMMRGFHRTFLEEPERLALCERPQVLHQRIVSALIARKRGQTDEDLSVLTDFEDGRTAVFVEVGRRDVGIGRRIGYEIDGSSHQFWVDVAPRFLIA